MLPPALSSCCDLIAQRVSEVSPKLLPKLADEFMTLAEQSRLIEAQERYLACRLGVRQLEVDFTRLFARHFKAIANEKARQADITQPKPTLDSLSAKGLSLVEDDALEASIARSNLARRAANAAKDELSPCSIRVAHLLGVEKVDEDDNPIGPGAICLAIERAIEDGVQSKDPKVKPLLVDAVAKHLDSEWESLYAKLNDLLIKAGIMPEIRATIRRSASGAGGAAARGEGAAPAEGASPQDTFSSLAQAVGGAPPPGPPMMGATGPAVPSPGGGAHAAGAPMGGGQGGGTVLPAEPTQLLGGWVSGSIDPTQTLSGPLPAGVSGTPVSGGDNYVYLPAPTQGLVKSMTAWQHGIAGGETSAAVVGALAGEGEAPPAARQAVQVISGAGLDPTRLAVGTVNIIRDIKNSEAAKDLPQLDAMTIDIVAMLFDYVFDDKNVPDSVKALLGRLQIPVLKVAMLDRTFFAKKDHPARALVDTIASASLGVDPQGGEDPLLKKIESTITHVQENFDTDIALFSDALTDFKQFLDSFEQTKREFDDRSTEIAEERLNEEALKAIIRAEIEQRVEGQRLPKLISMFLSKPWLAALYKAHTTEGKESTRYGGLVATIDDLVQSVQWPRSVDERRALIQLIPKLISRLQEGIKYAGIAEDESSPFMSALFDVHSAILKTPILASARKVESARPEAEEIPTVVLGEEEEEEAEVDPSKPATKEMVLSLKGINFQEIRLRGRQVRMHGVGVYSQSYLEQLKRGDWIEFRRGNMQYVRCRLTWVAPQRNLFLFTNLHDQSALSITPDALLEELNAGSATLIQDSPLIERAVNRILNLAKARPTVH